MPAGMRGSTRVRVVLGASVAAGIALFVLSLLLGSAELPARSVWQALFGHGDDAARVIVTELRVPRALAAWLVGAALAVSGLQMQTVFRNALADPYLLGLSAGASLGVACALLFGGAVAGSGWLLVGAAALGAALVAIFMVALAARIEDAVLLLVLGVVVAAMLGALVMALVFFADPMRTRAYVEWGFGSFARVTARDLRVLVPAVIAGLGLAWWSRPALDALLLGERYARSLGIEPRRARVAILGSASLLAGATVALAGPIGFLGIAVPHVARALVGAADHRRLLPASCLLGGAFGLACGLFAELPGSAAQFPVNAASALLCGPFVFWVLWRLRRELQP